MRLSSTMAAPDANRLVAVLVERRREDRSEKEQPEDDARVPGAQRPPAVDDLIGTAANRELGQPADREPEPGADEDLRRDRPPPAGARHERERGEPAREQDHAAGAALDDARATADAGDRRRSR